MDSPDSSSAILLMTVTMPNVFSSYLESMLMTMHNVFHSSSLRLFFLPISMDVQLCAPESEKLSIDLTLTRSDLSGSLLIDLAGSVDLGHGVDLNAVDELDLVDLDLEGRSVLDDFESAR